MQPASILGVLARPALLPLVRYRSVIYLHLENKGLWFDERVHHRELLRMRMRIGGGAVLMTSGCITEGKISDKYLAALTQKI